MINLVRGMVVWVDFDPVQGREQAGRRPALVVSSPMYLRSADSLVVVVPCTTVDRGWPNHIQLQGSNLVLAEPTFAMTEQPRTISRERIYGSVGVIDKATQDAVDMWLRDFLSL